MPPETTDLFEVEHIEYVADRSVDEVTDGKYASEVASATRPGVCETFEAVEAPGMVVASLLRSSTLFAPGDVLIVVKLDRLGRNSRDVSQSRART
jgi:DNA invertase Pin-like site-specific DNA recombinase